MDRDANGKRIYPDETDLKLKEAPKADDKKPQALMAKKDDDANAARAARVAEAHENPDGLIHNPDGTKTDVDGVIHQTQIKNGHLNQE